MFINSMIPKDVNYACLLDPASTTKALSRVTLAYKSKERETQEQGRSLTQVEIDWGEERLQRGPKRRTFTNRMLMVCTTRAQVP